MIKSSNHKSINDREPAMVRIRCWTFGEWTYEGGRKRKQVVTDGSRTRYQFGLHFMCNTEWMETSIWVVPQDYKSCPFSGASFFIFQTEE